MSIEYSYNMIIKNINSLPLIDYRLVKPLQGSLKDLTKANYQKLKNVLNKRGFDVPLFLWLNDGTYYLMDGHQRQRVMVGEDMNDDGSYDVPYLLIEADNELDAKAKLLEITSQYGTITQEGFDEFIVDLPEVEVYELTHFDALPLLGINTDVPEVEEDEAPEVDEANPAISRLGEVYQLGRHRLMVGDATNEASVAQLMDGAKADMVFTDPPYGISIVGGNGKVGAGNLAKNQVYSEVIGDGTTDTAKAHYELVANMGVPKIIFWGGNYFVDFLPFSPSWLIWDKRGDMNGNNFADGEMAWCNFKTPVRIYKQIWNGMIREGEHESRVHPTQKPVTMLGNILKDFTETNQSVLDAFGGSGSTLIACEQLDRTCYMMELDPKYCDVIRKRYWKLVNDDEAGWEAGTIKVS